VPIRRSYTISVTPNLPHRQAKSGAAQRPPADRCDPQTVQSVRGRSGQSGEPSARQRRRRDGLHRLAPVGGGHGLDRQPPGQRRAVVRALRPPDQL